MFKKLFLSTVALGFVLGVIHVVADVVREVKQMEEGEKAADIFE